MSIDDGHWVVIYVNNVLELHSKSIHFWSGSWIALFVKPIHMDQVDYPNEYPSSSPFQGLCRTTSLSTSATAAGRDWKFGPASLMMDTMSEGIQCVGDVEGSMGHSEHLFDT